MNSLRDRLRDAMTVGLLVLVVVACTWRIGLAGRVLAGGDVFTYFYPYWAEAARALRAARLPLWNPTLFMGVPFAANSQVGLFYPFNWPLWLLLPAHRAVHATIVLHLCLAALSAYVWARRSLDVGRMASWTVGAMVALGGYLGAQVEHVNQVQGLAWLPLMLMMSREITRPEAVAGRGCAGATRDGPWWVPSARRLRLCCVLAAVIALVLLAGHTQTAFISLFAMGVYGLVPLVWDTVRGADWRAIVRGSGLLALGTVTGVALAAVQLLPTWELSRLSVRAQGLPFNERLSFSLSPGYLGRALMPPFGQAIPPDHLEHVAYVGATGLALALVGLVMDRPYGADDRRPRVRYAEQALVMLGLLFALGVYNPIYVLLARFVPGFAHFRVPARWLALYAVGVAAIAGRAVDRIWNRRPPRFRHVLIVTVALAGLAAWGSTAMLLGRKMAFDALTVGVWVALIVAAAALLWLASTRPRWATVGLVLLLTGELALATSALPRARATAAQAFTDMRPAIAHLLASDPEEQVTLGRFLSMSDITFDPGDLALIRSIYGPQLSEDQLYEYIVATKQKEVLSPNLPLAFGVSAVDGYDGGVLPLQRYVMMEQLLLAPEDVSIDGRLRENLSSIPEGRWLDLFNVGYVITDKLQDAWVDDVFYDLQFTARLGRGEATSVVDVPEFEATALGLVAHLEAGTEADDGAPIGVVRLDFADGEGRSFVLEAGSDARHSGPDLPVDDSMVARLTWGEGRRPVGVTVESKVPEGALVVRGMSLIDERTGTFQALVASDRGHLRLVHSGDVKIYENLDVLPRAFIVSRAAVLDDRAAIAAMNRATFDPRSEVVLGGDSPSCRTPLVDRAGGGQGGVGTATVTTYGPERVVVETSLDDPGYLVLTDAHYPGWQATVNGQPVPICRADVLFRTVALEPGSHRVVFTFRPASHELGAIVSVLSLVLLMGIWHERDIVGTVTRCYNRMQRWAGSGQ